MKWQAGHNDEMGWLQYGDFPNGQPLLSFVRRAFIQRVEIRVHNLTAHMDVGDEVSRFEEFSLEAGEGDAFIAVDGIGFIARDDTGAAVFTTGSSAYDEDLSTFHPVIKSITNKFTLWVGDKDFIFSIDDEHKGVLQRLFVHKNGIGG